ncbi:MAG: hypothetical protein JSW39_29315 [Desulfobacterales bacterium]|nr:MAG: hypothetical protein JSW39_29315 [Desulfobacterales bacterium]
MSKVKRVSEHLKDAILSIMVYVKQTTGDEPTQEEVAQALKSFFILNELSNQIKYQRKRPAEDDADPQNSATPRWTLNLMPTPKENFLDRAGIFKNCIKEAVEKAHKFIQDATGQAPSDAEIAVSLKSSFILSELNNQIAWQRQNPKGSKKSK